MGLYAGASAAQAVYAGATPAKAVYRGADLVWEAGGEPVPIIRQSAVGRAEVAGDSFPVTLPGPTLPGNLVVLLLAGENTTLVLT